MEYLKIAVGQPVNVEIISGPTYEEKFGKRVPVYIVSVAGSSKEFTATDRLMSVIEQFRTTSGNRMTIEKVEWGGGKTKYEVYAQGGSVPTHQPQQKSYSSTPAKKSYEDNGDLQDRILKGQCFNLAHAEYVSDKIDARSVMDRAKEWYLGFKSFKWEENKIEELPAFKEAPTDLPFD